MDHINNDYGFKSSQKIGSLLPNDKIKRLLSYLERGGFRPEVVANDQLEDQLRLRRHVGHVLVARQDVDGGLKFDKVV